MRFILDAQLPPALALFFTARGHEAVAVRDLGLQGADDREIWSKAEEMQAIVVTKDEDFVHFVTLSEAGPSVIWVRTGNAINRVLTARFELAWTELEGHLEQGVRLVELR